MGMPISRRLGAAKRNAGWNLGAKQKPMPACSTQRNTPCGDNSIATPKASEHVGGTALRRRGASAVLADRHPGPGDDDGGHRADVDRVAAIAAGADDVDGARPQLVTERHECRRVEHGVEQTRQLLGGLALGAQGDDEPDQLCGRRVAGEDGRHRCAGIGGDEIAPFEQLRQQRGPSTEIVECDTSSDYGLRPRAPVRFAASAD